MPSGSISQIHYLRKNSFICRYTMRSASSTHFLLYWEGRLLPEVITHLSHCTFSSLCEFSTQWDWIFDRNLTHFHDTVFLHSGNLLTIEITQNIAYIHYLHNVLSPREVSDLQEGLNLSSVTERLCIYISRISVQYKFLLITDCFRSPQIHLLKFYPQRAGIWGWRALKVMMSLGQSPY